MVEKGNALSLSTCAAHPHMVISATIKAAAARAEDAAALLSSTLVGKFSSEDKSRM